LVRPSENEYDLHNLNNLPDNDLRPEFLNGIQAIKTLIASQAQLKSLKGRHINGSDLI
jgi:hypothetical protein